MLVPNEMNIKKVYDNDIYTLKMFWNLVFFGDINVSSSFFDSFINKTIVNNSCDHDHYCLKENTGE